MPKPTLCLDFDGVIHSYTSGWQGYRSIPDPPVEGAIEAILNYQRKFTVAIHSSRSHQGFLFLGRWHMRHWLYTHSIKWYVKAVKDNLIHESVPYRPVDGPIEDQAADWADDFIHSIQWPIFKPSALATLDDRGIRFTGQWPTNREIFAAKPWYKK